MFIDRIRLDAFGKLRGEMDFSRDRCNLICQDNEFGKSTVVDAILFSFYGFPSHRSRSGELRGLDKYRPWGSDGKGSYRVELELADEDGRTLQLIVNFDRQQPFELRDLETQKPLPLEGMPFGQKYFRMPMRSFTECFFFRQDEHNSGDRGDLIHAIQEAAVSNRRGQDAPIRVALKALDECKVHFEEFSANPIRIDTLLKRINEQLHEAVRRRDALLEEREKHAREMAQAEDTDREIELLQEEQARLEFECLLAEVVEVDARLSQQDSLAAAVRQRQDRQRELERYADFNPSRRTEVQGLYAEWRALCGRLEDIRRQLKERILTRIGELEAELDAAPPSLVSVRQEDLDKLRSLRQRYPGQESALRRQQEEVDRMRAGLEREGIPVDQFELMHSRLGSLPESDHALLVEQSAVVSDMERELADAQKRSGEAAVAASQARARLERVGTLMAIMVGTAGILAAIGAWLLMAKMPFLAVVFILLAAAVAGVGAVHVSKRQKAARAEREPALATEIAAASEVNRLLESLETARTRLKATSERVGLSSHELGILAQMDVWTQQVAPYRTAATFLERLRSEFDETCSAACDIVCKLAPKANPENLDAQLLADSCDRIEKFLAFWSEHQRLESERDFQLSEISTMEKRLAEKGQALEGLLGRAEPAGADMEARIAGFLDGCENAVRLRALIESADPSQLLGEEDLQCLRERLDLLKERIADIRAQRPDYAEISAPSISRARLQDQTGEVRTRREELRVRRLQAFNECDRAIEAWRQEGPCLEAEIERLEQLRGDMTELRDAVRLAHGELAAISEEVFSEWAATLNRRANQVLPLINPNYEEIRFSEELEVSVYSHEAERRLDARELAHLSKGARDQLALAVRVAISEYLAAHVGNLPLVFDEPFAHWDDNRFADGVRYLAELSERHQVIVLSCHRSRYRSLRTSHPELAERLNQVDLRML